MRSARCARGRTLGPLRRGGQCHAGPRATRDPVFFGVGFGCGFWVWVPDRGLSVANPYSPSGCAPNLVSFSGSSGWFWALVLGRRFLFLGFLWSLVWVGREHTGPIPIDAGGAVGPSGPFPGSVGMGNF